LPDRLVTGATPVKLRKAAQSRRCGASKASASSVARAILPHARQGCEDLNVTLLLLPRLGLLGWDAGDQPVEPLMSVLKLTVDETDTGNERGEMCAGGFDCAGGDLHGRLAQNLKHMGASKRRMRWRLRTLALVVSRLCASIRLVS
jgi:hypothetical protein